MRFELELSDPIGLVTVSDGCIKIEEEGNIRISFLPNVTGTGKLKLKDKEEKEIKAKGFGIFQWQGIKIQKCVSRCSLGWFQSDSAQAFTLKYLGTKKTNFDEAGMSIAVQDGQITMATKESNLELADGESNKRSGKMKIAGKDKNNREVTMETDADEMYQVTKIKILDKLPFYCAKLSRLWSRIPPSTIIRATMQNSW